MAGTNTNHHTASDRIPNRLRRLNLAVAVLVVSTTIPACALMVEPPDFPGAIRNLLGEPVEIYEHSLEHPDTTTLVVQLDPGALHELPALGDRCYGAGLVALGSDGEVGQLEDLCAIASDEVWVLHSDGHYVTSYEGDNTYYYRD